MDAKTTDQPKDKSLMDKIAADPEIINRSVTDVGEVEVVPAPHESEAAVALDSENLVEQAGAVRMDGQGGFGAPTLNLLGDIAPVAAPVPVVAAPVLTPKRKVGPLLGAAAVLLLGLGGGGYYLYAKNSAAPMVAVATPSPSPTITPTPSPSPTPTPTPTPAPIPVAANVTAPAAVPTADHPQAVNVKSPSGLWLRSGPDSSNKKNIIGWIPNGASVSVDAVGDFWWHGTYGGKVGYFASNYTQ